MPSSPHSTVSSALENSTSNGQQETSDGESNASYGEEQFESENEHEPLVVNSSSSENYASDEFEANEHNQETFITSTVEREALESDVGGEQIHSDDDEYEYESFEDERETSTEIDQQPENREVDPQESDGNPQPGNENIKPDEVNGSVPVVDKDFDLQVGTWCSKKIRELQGASSQPKSRRSLHRNTKRTVVKIPAVVVKNVIHRAKRTHPPHEKHGNSWQLEVPTSLMQRVQTQLWIAKSSSKESIEKSEPKTPPTSPRYVAGIFCSVKRDNLLGQLATMQVSESTKGWAAPDSGGLSLGMFEFIHNLAAKQRKIYAANGATDKSEGRMLHRVTMAARLQLEDSIALRNQAEELLGR